MIWCVGVDGGGVFWHKFLFRLAGGEVVGDFGLLVLRGEKAEVVEVLKLIESIVGWQSERGL